MDAVTDRDQIAHENAWDQLPYGAVPPHTRRGVQHKVVAIDGTMWSGWGRVGLLVVGRTACGKKGLVMDRGSTGPFPLCRRCYPRGDTDEVADHRR